ncbi:hypothetical protein [Marinoscillum furvescens]|uniref:Glycosyl transferase family 2 n=1 Tax=Marinoscillum furvescens DSM 4134 TaxID=1122208 RepID=A0A3D9KYJ7_MARFU|nr:hypothetical protein [Marinoscillum furvescens]RED92301.1 hypothetical protein C7460_13115 [Marinoscillum furvescens DSM 4134]
MKPYLSIVAASRNDNHGGDLNQRMEVFLRGLYHQLGRHQLATEIIIVEWNPPADKPRLSDTLPKPPQGNPVTLRIITVPKSIHEQYETGKILPLFQMTAKNVGIRRAKAPFILCTNIDLLFSDKLIDLLAKQKLQKGTYYRCNRCDIPKDINYEATIPELLKFARKNILQRLGKNRLYPNFNGQSKLWYHNIFTLGIVFVIAKLKRLMESAETTMIESADTWACGDFTLMHRDDWEQIQGYFELDAYSIHIDSLALFAALGQGIRQKILAPELCTYHISHQSGWELQDPMKKIKFDLKMPMLDWNTAHDACRHMYLQKEVLPINDKNWGFVDVNLEEATFNE